jgi:site-specific DNA recombinase
MERYLLYARKSTDVEDKQVLSIEAQLAELRAIARRDGIEIAEEFVEKQSAKMPGRPVFEQMLKRIEKGEAQGIVCWKIDRLSRNPVDSGRISWLLQRGVIQQIQTHDRMYLPHDNVLIMSVEFGMANEYIRQLSANTARGLRAKARLGDFPGTAPVGYRNDPRTKTIVLDRKKAKVIRAAFELYSNGESRIEDIGQLLYDSGVRSLFGNRIHDDRVKFILQNPFYYGQFLFAGELYEGRHTPIVDKRLFDKVQKVVVERGHPQAATAQPQALCGVMRCGECGMAITAEVRTKYQKNGNVHRYVYYRCTKKSVARCSQSYVREEALATNVSELLSLFVLPPEWARDFERKMQEDECDVGRTTAHAVSELREQMHDIDRTLDRLMDLYIAQDIERDVYLAKRRALMSDKRTLSEQITRLEHDGRVWLEPMRKWVIEAETLAEIQHNPSLPAKKSAIQKIFGSNLQLSNQKVSGTAHPLYAALRAARQNSESSASIQVWAPRVGVEPTTNSLTASCSTIELPRNIPLRYNGCGAV